MENGFSFLLKYFSDISKTSIQVLLALVLSLFFLLEKPRLIEFTNKFKDSKIAPFYYEIEFFGKKFTRTFGKVIEAQFIIAIVNTILSVIVLLVLGFPQVIGLAIMIFFLGLIPVAGVIISLVPLTIIAFTIGGFLKVVYVIIAVMIIHGIEAYILNPKLMSSKTDLPVFYTFIVLIFSQNFFGVWGLIIGIPVFVFLLDVLDVTNKEPGETYTHSKKQKDKVRLTSPLSFLYSKMLFSSLSSSFFHLQTGPKTAQLTTFRNDAMTRNNNQDRIGADSGSDSSYRIRFFNPFGNIRI